MKIDTLAIHLLIMQLASSSLKAIIGVFGSLSRAYWHNHAMHAFDAGMNHAKSYDTDATFDGIARLVHRGSAKALAMSHFSRLVAEGYAEWRMLEDGDIRLCLLTGEIYLLAKTTITRIA